MTEYKDKFIAFIDILGFKQLIADSEAGIGMPLADVLNLLEVFGSDEERQHFQKYGPILCPNANYIDKNLDFRLTQISDCAIVSAETSPAGVINLISHCAAIVVRLLLKGLMCRGYITRGLIYHTATQVIGSGYQAAFAAEADVTAFKREADERGTPFVEIDASVKEYVASCGNSCVQMMFSRNVKNDGTVSAVFPFARFSHSFAIGGFGGSFDPKKERESNDVVRSNIHKLKIRVEAHINQNDNALKKGRHYLAILDEQLVICDQTDEFIESLCKPFCTR